MSKLGQIVSVLEQQGTMTLATLICYLAAAFSVGFLLAAPSVLAKLLSAGFLGLSLLGAKRLDKKLQRKLALER